MELVTRVVKYECERLIQQKLQMVREVLAKEGNEELALFGRIRRELEGSID